MRVGTSLVENISDTIDEDHPHACGDKLIMLNGAMARLGSSPCVWGQVDTETTEFYPIRIIPMRVGTRGDTVRSAVRTEDHPHACGDKSFHAGHFNVYDGSSPCVWGQVTKRITVLAFIGIIPMRVGTRLKKSRKIAVLQNQPLRFPLTFHRSFV